LDEWGQEEEEDLQNELNITSNDGDDEVARPRLISDFDLGCLPPDHSEQIKSLSSKLRAKSYLVESTPITWTSQKRSFSEWLTKQTLVYTFIARL
jgi:hypothetical protein